MIIIAEWIEREWHEQDVEETKPTRHMYWIDFIKKLWLMKCVFVLIIGDGQTGKSSVAGKLIGTLMKDLKINDYYTFWNIAKMRLFYCNRHNFNKIIWLEEPQFDIESFLTKLFRLLKLLIEGFGIRKHLLIMITPDEHNIYRIRNKADITIECKIRYNYYSGNFYRHAYAYTKNRIFTKDKTTYQPIDDFDVDNIEDTKLWKKHIEEKNRNLHIRGNTTLVKLADSSKYDSGKLELNRQYFELRNALNKIKVKKGKHYENIKSKYNAIIGKLNQYSRGV